MTTESIFSVANKTIVIAGASGAIGFAIASHLSLQGAQVIGVDIEYPRSKFSGSFEMLDCSSDDEVAKFAKRIEHFCPSSIVCCSGSSGEVVDAEMLNLEKFRACIASSLETSALMVKHFCEQMKKRKDGQIVFLSSTAGLRGNALMPAYTAAKHGIIGLTRAYARELGPWGIRCNAVLPGLINSPMALDIQAQLAKRRNKDFVSTGLLLGASTGVPLGRIGEPQDVANAVHFLISKASSYCNGLMLNVDGGLLVK